LNCPKNPGADFAAFAGAWPVKKSGFKTVLDRDLNAKQTKNRETG
jgi:hypothetical protein